MKSYLYDLAIFINSAGPNINSENIKDTLTSLIIKAGTKNLSFTIYIDQQQTKDYYTQAFVPFEDWGVNLEFVESDRSWAINFNEFFENYKHHAEYILISHDDLLMRTDNYFNISKQLTLDYKKIGWITYTSDFYYEDGNIPMANSVREGFALDRFRYPFLYECHNFKTGDSVDPQKFDFPTGPVKVHAPFPHIMFIKSDALEDIGLCEDWTPYTLLIDEDWGMSALVKNYWNIWIPEIKYKHPLRYIERKVEGVRYVPQAHQAFYNKWGYYFGEATYSDEFIDLICEKYKDTNLPFLAKKHTFEYQYLNDEDRNTETQ